MLYFFIAASYNMVRGGVSEIKRKFFILLLPFFIALDIFSSLSLFYDTDKCCSLDFQGIKVDFHEFFAHFYSYRFPSLFHCVTKGRRENSSCDLKKVRVKKKTMSKLFTFLKNRGELYIPKSEVSMNLTP